MRHYTVPTNTTVSISLEVQPMATPDIKNKEPMFFLICETVERNMTTPVITETFERAMNKVVDYIKETFEDMVEWSDETIILILQESGQCTYEPEKFHFEAWGETANHDNIDWRIFPIYGNIYSVHFN